MSMVVYPIAVEVATSEGLNLHALSFTGLKTEKSYSSVHCYMVKTIQHMESLYNGRQCKLYQRMTDGCASQFWAYGSYASICELQKLGGGPTPFLYMATRFLANVHVQNVQNVQKLFFPVWKFPGKIYLLWLIHNDRYITWECI